MGKEQNVEVTKKDPSFETLVAHIQTVSNALKDDTLVVINRSVTARAWLTGYYIVEYEQRGVERPKHDDRLLVMLSSCLHSNEYTVLRRLQSDGISYEMLRINNGKEVCHERK